MNSIDILEAIEAEINREIERGSDSALYRMMAEDFPPLLLYLDGTGKERFGALEDWWKAIAASKGLEGAGVQDLSFEGRDTVDLLFVWSGKDED